jgi:hypothetical protein
MKSSLSRPLAVVFLIAGAPPAQAATFSWAEVQLTGASGVPNEPEHRYKFKGIITGTGSKKSTSTSLDLSWPPVKQTSSNTNAVFATIWVQGKGHWDAAKGEASENFHFDGDVRGQFASRLKCSADPWLAPASCAVISAQYKGEKGPLYDWPGMVHSAKRPLSAKAVDPALAAKLSQSAVATAPPPPAQAPPPKKVPVGLKSADKPAAAELPVLKLQAQNVPPAPVAAIPPVRPQLPDLESAARLRIAGKHTVAWGGSIVLTDADARTAANGVCQVAFEHEIRNVGTVATSEFSRRWNNEGKAGGISASAPSIPAGGALTRVDILALERGVNKLLMGLDNLNQVKEGNKNNNVYALTVTMNGTCAGPASVQANAAPGSSRVGGSHYGPAQVQGARNALPAVQSELNPGPPNSPLKQQQR